jgi:putative phage-type endonuclease
MSDSDGSGRAVWLAWRRHGIGGSDIAGLLGLSRYASPFSLWADKVGLRPEPPATERQWIGREFEPVLAKLVEARTGLFVAGEQTWCQRPDEAWMRCTVDGFLFESPDVADIDAAVGAAEFKTDARYGWAAVPDAIEAQCQWQMAVTGMGRVVVGVLFAGFRFETYTIERSEPDIAFMVQRARDFWCDYVLSGEPPPTDGSEATLEALSDIYRTPEPDRAVELPYEAREALEDWTAAKARKRAAETDERRAAAVLQAALGDAEEGLVEGIARISWRLVERKGYVVQPTSYRQLRAVTH